MTFKEGDLIYFRTSPTSSEYTGVYIKNNTNGTHLVYGALYGAANVTGDLVRSRGGARSKGGLSSLFKSKEQKLFESYVFDGESLDWNSPVVQKVFFDEFKEKLLAEARNYDKDQKVLD